MLNYFGNRTFMRHGVQVFLHYSIEDAYNVEKTEFKRTCRSIPILDVPTDANLVLSHVLNKGKVLDDYALKLKARIAPHGNENNLKLEVRIDWSMCSPMRVRVLLSTAALHKWRVIKLDVMAALLQTGPPSQDVYVIPPRESVDGGKVIWLLLTAAYGQVNANAKLKVQFDKALTEIGFVIVALTIPLFFYIAEARFMLHCQWLWTTFCLPEVSMHVILLLVHSMTALFLVRSYVDQNAFSNLV